MKDHPTIKEMKELMAFCGGRKYVYIYGCAEKQIRLEQYLLGCGVNMRGFVISDNRAPAEGLRCVRLAELPSCDKTDAGIILGLPDRYYNEVAADLRNKGFKHIFFLSERSKHTIAKSLTPGKRENFHFEVNLAEHCNLNCKCCDHHSQLAEEEFIDPAVLERDLERLSKLTDACIHKILLMGGEPLLNPRIMECMDIARRHFPKTTDKKTQITITTNGILLIKPKDEGFDESLWRKCGELGIAFDVTRYPINMDYSVIAKKAAQYNVGVKILASLSDPNLKTKLSTRHPFDLKKNIAPWQFICCHQFNRCTVLKKGRIYPCPISAHIKHFNKYFNLNLETEEADYIDIHKIESYEEIAEFLAMRTPFCGYCDIENRMAMTWGTSSKTLDEYQNTTTEQ